jgi:hypothetical protein
LGAFSVEMTHRVSPIAVDSVIFSLRPDPANAAVSSGLIHGVISAFLLYPADVVGPTPINVVISTFLLYMTNELGQPPVDFTICHFSHSKFSE